MSRISQGCDHICEQWERILSLPHPHPLLHQLLSKSQWSACQCSRAILCFMGFLFRTPFLLVFLSSLSQNYCCGQQLTFIKALSSSRSSISSKFLGHGWGCRDAEASGSLGGQRSFRDSYSRKHDMLGPLPLCAARKGAPCLFLDLTGNGSRLEPRDASKSEMCFCLQGQEKPVQNVVLKHTHKHSLQWSVEGKVSA